MRSDYVNETAKTSIITYTADGLSFTSLKSSISLLFSILNNNPKDWIGGVCFGPLARNVIFFAKAVINIHQESSEWIIAPLTTENNRLWVNHSSLTDLKCIRMSNFFCFFNLMGSSQLATFSVAVMRHCVQTQGDELCWANEQSDAVAVVLTHVQGFRWPVAQANSTYQETSHVWATENNLWQKYWLFLMEMK